VQAKYQNVRVLGQDLYPMEPSNPYGIRSYDDYPGWNDELTLYRNSANLHGVVGVGMRFSLPPPLCGPVTPEIRACAEVRMIQVIAGPKHSGEVYSVLHRDDDQIDPAPPAVYLNLEEGPLPEYSGLFPAYRSVSVTGTAIVVSESPFMVSYDVEFLDANGDDRDVTAVMSLSYGEECQADD